ncbi:MAG: methionyl-tRNA formyltransferase [Clostridia bacterium]|nr:methionyl-tRNA formyltransferase [Clostridia bacterium]
MRIVFMGTPDFAVPSLKALISAGYDIAGVFTQPDRPKGRGNRLTPSPVKTAALEAGIPVFQPEKIRKTGVEDLRGLKPDLCVTAAFGQILSQEILDIAPMGNINVHASLLPRHRGAAPVAYALMDGETKTGVTTMWMDAGIDTGDILLQAETNIEETETCGELTERLSRTGAELLIRTLKELEAGTLISRKQDETRMTYDPMLSKSMGIADFTQSATQIKGLINGMNPWPCVTVPAENGRLKLLRAAVTDGTGEPGMILSADTRNGLVIACGTGAVRVLEIQAPGGKPMKSEDYLRGHSLPAGMNLKEDNA